MRKFLFVLCLLPSFLIGCGSNELNCELEISTFNDYVEFHTEKQLQYIRTTLPDTLPSGIEGTIDNSKPVPTNFSFKATGKGVKEDVQYVLKLGKSSSLRDAEIYCTNDESVDVTNLEVDTLYFYKVSAISNGKIKESPLNSFITTDTNFRNIDINGVANCRDIGGFVADDGIRSTQGLIYRTGRLNVSASESDIYPKPLEEVFLDITDDGVYTMLNQLQVKSEIDVRLTRNNEVGFITSSPLGDDVNYYNIPMEWDLPSNSNLIDANKAKIIEFFQILGDEENYPMFIHCDIGTDRTGMFAILLHGLLGDSMDDIHKDYMFSNFGMIKASRVWTKTDPYRNRINAKAGADFSEKVRNYLIQDVGVNEQDIDNYISYMKDGINFNRLNDTYIKVINYNKEINIDDSYKIDYVIESTRELSNYKMKFTSSDESVLKVDEYGNLTPIKSGEAKITMNIDKTNIKKEIEYKVFDPYVDRTYSYKFEGENAVLGGSSSKPSVKTKYQGDEEYGSDGILVSCVDSVSGQYLEYKLNSTATQDVSMFLRVAVYSRAFDFCNKVVKSIEVNNEILTLDDSPLLIENILKYSTMPWYNWGRIVLDDVRLNEGENIIRINIANSPKTNFDYLAIDAESDITLAA